MGKQLTIKEKEQMKQKGEQNVNRPLSLAKRSSKGISLNKGGQFSIDNNLNRSYHNQFTQSNTVKPEHQGGGGGAQYGNYSGQKIMANFTGPAVSFPDSTYNFYLELKQWNSIRILSSVKLLQPLRLYKAHDKILQPRQSSSLCVGQILDLNQLGNRGASLRQAGKRKEASCQSD